MMLGSPRRAANIADGPVRRRRRYLRLLLLSTPRHYFSILVP